MTSPKISKALAILLAITMIVTCIPGPVFADTGQEEQEYSAQNDEVMPAEMIQKEEDIPEEDEQDEPRNYPEFTPESVMLDTVVISAWAPEGVFPEGAVLSVQGVPGDKQERIDAELEPLRDKEKDVIASYSFDIRALSSEGITELEPAESAKVQAAFSLEEVADQSLEARVYQVTEDKATGELSAQKLQMISDQAFWGGSVYGDPEITIVTETDRFSCFIVEFAKSRMEDESVSQVDQEENTPEGLLMDDEIRTDAEEIPGNGSSRLIRPSARMSG